MLQPGINVPSSISGGGNIKRDSGLYSNHIFNVGLERPQILESLLVKFPKSYLLKLTEKISASRQLYNNTFNWTVMDRTRSAATVTAISNGTTASATLTLDTPYDSSADAAGYWLVGDTFYSPSGKSRGIVTAVGNSGNFQTITVARPDGSNWSTTTINTGFLIGHTGTSFGQGSAGSGGFRSYLPTQDYNVSTISRRGIKITRNAMKDRTVLEDGSWFHHQEDFEHKNLLVDIEATALAGSRYKNTSIGGRSQSRGLIEYAEGSGQNVTYSGSIGVQEADLMLFIEQLVPQQGSDDIILLTGLKLHSALQRVLGNNYREIPTSEQPRQLAGLNFQSYYFFNKRIHFQYYDLFSDPTIFPAVSASSTAYDFREFGIALDFGQVDGQIGGPVTNIEMGWVQPVTQKAITGMASESYEISDPFDGAQFELLTEFMPICYMPNRLGLLYSVG
jgi:hypothetical protein